MRIVYIHQYFCTPEMSGGTRSYELARRLAAHGHKVDVITTDGKETGSRALPHWHTTIESGITVHWINLAYSNKMGYTRRIVAFFLFVFYAARKATQIERDVVFATSTPLTVALPGAYAACRGHVPFVLEVRDLWPEVPIALGALKGRLSRRLAYGLEAWAYRRARHVIALSPDMEESIKTRFPKTRVTVVPNACDVDLFKSADESGDALRRRTSWLSNRPSLVYAGALGMVNGVSYLVDVASYLRQLCPEARVAVVGAGRELDLVRKYAQRKGVLDENFFLLEPVSKSEIVAWFGAATLAVSTVIDVPELSANSANKVFDALAAGRPVAINHSGWLAELLTTSGAGLVLPPTDAEKGAMMLSAYFDDTPGQELAHRAAMSLASGLFSRDYTASLFEEVLSAAYDQGS